MSGQDVIASSTEIAAQLTSLAAAAGIGMLIGLERERRKYTSKTIGRVPGGLRTFLLVAIVGCVAMQAGGLLVLASVTLATGMITSVAYFLSRDSDPGITTEIALLLTLLLGGLTVNNAAMAVGIAVIVAIVLAARELVHEFVRESISEFELRDGLVLATASLVVWPLLPDRALDPVGAINLKYIWMIVVLVMLTGAVGHIGTRLFGARLGLPFAGFTSGFVSSTATIAAMGEKAAGNAALVYPAVAGAALSTVATFVQLAILIAVLSKSMLLVFLPELLTGVVVSALYGLFIARLATESTVHTDIKPSRMFSLKTAFGLALVVSIVLFVTAVLNQYFGTSGITAAAAVSGFADVHSIGATVASFVASSLITPDDAVLPLLLAISTNTFSKIVMAVINGPPAFWLRVAPGLLLVLLIVWLVGQLT